MREKWSLLFGLVLGSVVGVVAVVLWRIDRRLDEQEIRLTRLAAAIVVTNPEPSQVQLAPDSWWKVLGSADAPVTIIEFTDYECPFCKQFHREVYPQIEKEYIATGKVRWISRELPLDIHPFAARAAEAALCAGDQQKYWQMRDALLNADATLSELSVVTAASRLSIDAGALQSCMDGRKYEAWIADDIADARVLEISGTPAFVIARTDADVLEGAMLIGYQPLTALRQFIEAATPR